MISNRAFAANPLRISRAIPANDSREVNLLITVHSSMPSCTILQEQPEKIGEWHTASHVERQKRKKDEPAKPNP
jgi:hypothetical protein